MKNKTKIRCTVCNKIRERKFLLKIKYKTTLVCLYCICARYKYEKWRKEFKLFEKVI